MEYEYTASQSFEPQYHLRPRYFFTIDKDDNISGAYEITFSEHTNAIEKVFINNIVIDKFFSCNEVNIHKGKIYFYSKHPVASICIETKDKLNSDIKIKVKKRKIYNNIFNRRKINHAIARFNGQSFDYQVLDLNNINNHPAIGNILSLPKQHIDILMATYNGEKYIAEQIESILNQTYKNFRLVIRDDMSQDKTVAIIKKYMQSDPRITLIETTENIGYVKNFESLIYHSNAEYIFFSDQDDYWYPDKIKDYIEVLTTEDCSLIFSDLEVVDQYLKPIHKSFWKMMNLNIQEGKHIASLGTNNFVTGCTVAFKKNILMFALPLNNHTLPHDHHLALVGSECKGIKPIHKSYIKYRQHDNNLLGAFSDILEIFYYNGEKLITERQRYFFDDDIRDRHVKHVFIIQENGSNVRIDPTFRLSEIYNLSIYINDIEVKTLKFTNMQQEKDNYINITTDPQIYLDFKVKPEDKISIEYNIKYTD